MRRLSPVAVTAFCLLVALTGCRNGTGARPEGQAATKAVRHSADTRPAIADDSAALARIVKKDPKADAEIRRQLVPCAGDDYPVDTDAGVLTGGDGPDLVVNVTTCDDGLGVASYVYRLVDGRYENIFADEQPPVYGSVADGKLEIIREVYKSDDPVLYPTGQETVTYVWQEDRFVSVARTYADYAEQPAPPETASATPTAASAPSLVPGSGTSSAGGPRSVPASESAVPVPPRQAQTRGGPSG